MRRHPSVGRIVGNFASLNASSRIVAVVFIGIINWLSIIGLVCNARIISEAAFSTMSRASTVSHCSSSEMASRCICELDEPLTKKAKVNEDIVFPKPTVREAVCRGAAFTDVPPDLPPTLIKLDLTSNNITELKENSFSNFTELEELILADNVIGKIHPKTFSQTVKLKRLSLQHCGLSTVPSLPLKMLKQLTSLQLDQNDISYAEQSDFAEFRQLRNLRLDNNEFAQIPTEALRSLHSLEVLNMASNQIKQIPINSFPHLPNLIVLFLKRNHIVRIDEDAFLNLPALRVLELDDNSLVEIPLAVTKLTNLQELSVSGNKIRYIPGGILQKSRQLVLLELKGNPLKGVDPYAFSYLPKLRKLILSEARELREFPNLNGTSTLEVLRLDRASLFSIPSSLCVTCPYLKSLDFKANKLGRIPDITDCKALRLLDLSSNYITSLEGQLFDGLNFLHDLMLANNLISRVPKDAFVGLPQLQVLDLEGNLINYIHPETFTAIPHLEDLNLGNNHFPTLPIAGLQKLLHLKTFNNPNLREFPSPENFPRIQTLVLSYAYHCCSFLAFNSEESSTLPSLHESVIFPKDSEFDLSLWNSSLTDVWPQLQNMSTKFGSQVNDLWDAFGADFTYPGNLPSYVEEYFEEQQQQLQQGDGSDETDGVYSNRRFEAVYGRIKCLPMPGPFLPCQDLFDWWTLRCGVWVVFLLAMLGNGTVVFVLIFSRSKFDVPRFLVCNLAAADFFMGVYLGFLAVVDASTLGEFRMYAIKWQMSNWCQLSGVLAVLSSELSVYTLAVITLERNYAITHAMHLNKRLSLKHASYIMLIGWTFACTMAVLPLFGVSDYRKFATCLPFEITTGFWSLAYVVFLMFVNGLAFLVLMGCYLKMYCAIRGSQAWNSNDSRIAKRMALLVFTDFLCWSPIAFFSLTAIFGLQLVTLEQAKVFTVFVLPLNSCCNPFLYAILTKQFKKDCVLICKAIEESRVTRGIGRCRHSSNFSNRQTPANTNSLVDRSSKENYHQQQQQQPSSTQPCTCQTKLLGGEKSNGEFESSTTWPHWRRWLCSDVLICSFFHRRSRTLERNRRRRCMTRSDEYAYQIAEIQQKQHKRASSVSSSENFSSSRSDSWRHQHHHHHHNCGGIPMRLLDPKRKSLPWLVTRKTSQDSNLSNSRNDSSGSGNTASTSLSRVSRSSASSDSKQQQKPRLTRQSAVVDETDPLVSPAKLTVRFLTTIPSAAENSTQQDEEDLPIVVDGNYAVLQPSSQTPEMSSVSSIDASPRSLSPTSITYHRRSTSPTIIDSASLVNKRYSLR